MPHKTMDEQARAAYESQCLELRVELKKWESDWATAHGGQKPGRDDIKQRPDIGTYLPPRSMLVAFPRLKRLRGPQPTSTNSTISYGTSSQARSRPLRQVPPKMSTATSSASGPNPRLLSPLRPHPRGPRRPRRESRRTILSPMPRKPVLAPLRHVKPPLPR